MQAVTEGDRRKEVRVLLEQIQAHPERDWSAARHRLATLNKLIAATPRTATALAVRRSSRGGPVAIGRMGCNDRTRTPVLSLRHWRPPFPLAGGRRCRTPNPVTEIDMRKALALLALAPALLAVPARPIRCRARPR